MGLKLVGGSAKGRKLKGPKKGGIRPASARVRKSVFDILGNLAGQNVLDLFAGTGSMGMEALSKGAREVTFVDLDSHAIDLLFHNLRTTGFLKSTRILKKSATAAIASLSKKKQAYDLIFLDPPYDQGQVEQCLKKMHRYNVLKDDGLLLCEHSPRETITFLGGLEVVDERKYGQTIVTFLKKAP